MSEASFEYISQYFHFTIAVSTKTTGMHHSFWNTFMIEMENLFAHDVVFD